MRFNLGLDAYKRDMPSARKQKTANDKADDLVRRQLMKSAETVQEIFRRHGIIRDVDSTAASKDASDIAGRTN